MEELKKCPFCGGDASKNKLEQVVAFDLHTVSCENKNCGVHPYAVGLTWEEAFDKWNKRAGD